jgi:hypothetical protein
MTCQLCHAVRARTFLWEAYIAVSAAAPASGDGEGITTDTHHLERINPLFASAVKSGVSVFASEA